MASLINWAVEVDGKTYLGRANEVKARKVWTCSGCSALIKNINYMKVELFKENGWFLKNLAYCLTCFTESPYSELSPNKHNHGFILKFEPAFRLKPN